LAERGYRLLGPLLRASVTVADLFTSTKTFNGSLIGAGL
jgi:hypothetical protein